jgi:crossover junction endodeoxyribonuclease RuvC
MIVLGIDPGSRSTGYGVIEIRGDEQVVLAYGAIHPGKSDSHALRLSHIHEKLVDLLDRTKPDACAIEMPVYAQNAQSMLKLGRAQAAAMLAAVNRQIPVAEYTPKQVKKSVTGNGNASKDQVWFMVKKLLGITEDRGADASDALAIALCHAHRLSRSSEVGDAPTTSWAAFVRANPDRIVDQ